MDNTARKKSNLGPMIALTSLFFMWGFITSMNDILIPYLKKVFELSYFQAMLVQFCFFGAYFIGSLVYFIISARMGDPIAKMGYKNGIIAGLLLSAIACLMFYPAAQIKIFAYFLAALFVLGIGFTLLQIAANPYVAILGKPETASSRLNLSQALNSLGHTTAPIIGGYLVFSFFTTVGKPLLNKFGEPILTDKGLTLTATSVQLPYLVFAGLFILLAAIFAIARLPKFNDSSTVEKGNIAIKFPHVRLGMIAIFLYVGAEVAIGSVFINYMKELMNFPEIEAKSFLAFYWGGAMTGRFLGAISLSDEKNQIKKMAGMIITSLMVFFFIFFVIHIENGMEFRQIAPFLAFLVINLIAFRLGRSLPNRTLTVFALVIIGLLLTTLLTGGIIAMWTIIGIGLFNSIMWSNIFTLTIKDLGKYTSQASSLLVMMILGGALIPPLQGAVADAIGIHYSFFVPILSYIYLAYYGWKGYKYKIEKSIISTK